MTQLAASTPASRKIPIASLLRGAFAPFFRHPRAVLKASALPFAMTLILWVVTSFVFLELLAFSKMAAVLSYLVLMIFCLFPPAVLGVSLFRLLLLGPQAARTEILTRRVWISFGLTAAVACAVILAVTLFFWVAAAAGIRFPDLATSGRILFLVGYFSLLALLLYSIGRLSLVYPSISIDEGLALVSSWRLSRGNGLRLLAALAAATVLLALIFAGGSMALTKASSFMIWLNINVIPAEYHFWPGTFVRILPSLVLLSLWSCLGAALLAGTVATAYTHLTGWGAPRQDILERFE